MYDLGINSKYDHCWASAFLQRVLVRTRGVPWDKPWCYHHFPPAYLFIIKTATIIAMQAVTTLYEYINMCMVNNGCLQHKHICSPNSISHAKSGPLQTADLRCALMSVCHDTYCKLVDTLSITEVNIPGKKTTQSLCEHLLFISPCNYALFTRNFTWHNYVVFKASLWQWRSMHAKPAIDFVSYH